VDETFIPPLFNKVKFCCDANFRVKEEGAKKMTLSWGFRAFGRYKR
jgi:hypothetical protein